MGLLAAPVPMGVRAFRPPVRPRDLMIFVRQLATLLIVLIGLVVGAIAVAVFLPIAR